MPRLRWLAVTIAVAPCATGQDLDVDVQGAAGVSPARVEAVRRLALDAVREFAGSFACTLRPFRVAVHADDATLPGEVRRSLHEGTAGVAMLELGEVHLILARCGVQPPDDLRTVVRHEVVHVLLYQCAGRHVPRWFHEGLAQALTGHAYLGVSEEDIVFHARTGTLLLFSKLRHAFPSGAALRTAYAQSFSFVSFLRRKVGLQPLLAAASRCGPDRDYASAFYGEVGTPLAEVEQEWVEYVATGSGAAWRVVLASCFALSMVVVLPLLALAGSRRWNRDLRSRRELERQEQLEQGSSPGEPGGDRDRP